MKTVTHFPLAQGETAWCKFVKKRYGPSLDVTVTVTMTCRSSKGVASSEVIGAWLEKALPALKVPILRDSASYH
jgi:hypothetical protein